MGTRLTDLHRERRREKLYTRPPKPDASSASDFVRGVMESRSSPGRLPGSRSPAMSFLIRSPARRASIVSRSALATAPGHVDQYAAATWVRGTRPLKHGRAPSRRRPHVPTFALEADDVHGARKGRGVLRHDSLIGRGRVGHVAGSTLGACGLVRARLAVHEARVSTPDGRRGLLGSPSAASGHGEHRIPTGADHGRPAHKSSVMQ